MSREETLPLISAFRFTVSFRQAGASGAPIDVCSGAFAECTGLEATMEPKLIKVGGLNYGGLQRAGTVSFATVVLKRGMTSTRHLYEWFQMVAGGQYHQRRNAEVAMQDPAGNAIVTWGLDNCLPVKFRCADLNAKTGEVAIEELHLAHEGLRLFAKGGA
jgi:phage tail-like protein